MCLVDGRPAPAFLRRKPRGDGVCASALRPTPSHRQAETQGAIARCLLSRASESVYVSRMELSLIAELEPRPAGQARRVRSLSGVALRCAIGGTPVFRIIASSAITRRYRPPRSVCGLPDTMAS